MALYAVGCQSWHDNLKQTFDKNKITWLQYDVNIKKYYEFGFKERLKNDGYFYVYGHVTKKDYDFCNLEPKEVKKGEYCFKTRNHSDVKKDILSKSNELGKVSVIYKIINDPEPIISIDKQLPPPEAPPFKAYDIKQGHCDILDFRDCDRIKCENRKSCKYKQEHCFYEYAYQTWLPVGKIISIEPIKHNQFYRLRRGLKDKVNKSDLRYKRIFPVILHEEHINIDELNDSNL